MKKLIFNHETILIGILIILCFVVIFPFFHSGFFPTHDGEWTVVRLSDMFRTLKDGQFPARYSGYLNNQYGYPLFNFAYPLPYYIGMFPALAQMGFLNSIKLLFVVSTFTSIIGMYLLSRAFWKNNISAVVSAVLFLFLPYRMVDLYVRGSLGEIVSFGITPFLFLTLYFSVVKKSWRYAWISGILAGMLITAHNIMALLFIPLLGVFGLTLVWTTNKKNIKYVIVSLLVGVSISAFFWLPALVEKQYILLSRIPIADRSLYFVKLQQLILPSWGYGVPTDSTDAFTYQLGIPQLFASLASIWFAVHSLFFKKEKILNPVFIIIGGIIILICILLMFEFSSELWKMLPLLSEINYPWTLIAPIGFLTAFLSGYAVKKNTVLKVVIIILTIGAVIQGISYAKPSEYVDRTDDFYMTNAATTTSSHEYMPLWVEQQPLESPTEKVEIIDGNGKASLITNKSNKIKVVVNGDTNMTVRINTIYYPGWEIKVDRNEVLFSYDNPRGVMDVKVPKGEHAIEAVFTETPLRMFANSVSLITFLVVVGVIGISFKRK